MKKLTKIMLSLAAASVMTAAMAVTAMAVDTITGTYDNTTGQVTMNGVIGSGKSQTILVLDGNEDIAYINQIDNNGTFSTFMLASGLESPTPVTFNIKIGGSNKELQTGTLTISGSPATVTIKFGNIDMDANGRINAKDVKALQQFVAKIKNDTNANVETVYTVVSGMDGVETFKFGNIDMDANGRINAKDVKALQQFVAKIKNDTNANVGNDVVVVDEK